MNLVFIVRLRTRASFSCVSCSSGCHHLRHTLSCSSSFGVLDCCLFASLSSRCASFASLLFVCFWHCSSAFISIRCGVAPQSVSRIHALFFLCRLDECLEAALTAAGEDSGFEDGDSTTSEEGDVSPHSPSNMFHALFVNFEVPSAVVSPALCPSQAPAPRNP